MPEGPFCQIRAQVYSYTKYGGSWTVTDLGVNFQQI